MLITLNNIKIFEDRKIRTAWNADSEEWYFNVVDVIAVLTDRPRPRKESYDFSPHSKNHDLPLNELCNYSNYIWKGEGLR